MQHRCTALGSKKSVALILAMGLGLLMVMASAALAAPPVKVAISGTESIVVFDIGDSIFRGPFEYFSANGTTRLDCSDARATGDGVQVLDYKVHPDGTLSFSGTYDITLDTAGVWRGKITGGRNTDGIWYGTVTARGYDGEIDGARLQFSIYDYAVEGVITIK